MKHLLTLLHLFWLSAAFAQQPLSIGGNQMQDKSAVGGVPQSVYTQTVSGAGAVRLHLKPNHPFSCFGIGWQAAGAVDRSLLQVRYRTLQPNGLWSKWYDTEAEFAPEDTPTGLYWTEAVFTHDAGSHTELELEINHPAGVYSVKVDMFDGNAGVDLNKSLVPQQPGGDPESSSACPAFPSIITRAQWCGGSAPCSQVNAAYTPTYITPTHIVIHHGASPDTYTSGQAVVQSYYNYHVNTLGWSDIGYNFIVDKNGNFFQGRHNPNLTTSDVRGAHAGNANGGSIGINFPGNADVTIATTVQLNVVNQLMAWWFNRRGLDPTSSASMVTQAYGTQVQPRICGHRDIGQTTCPGNDLYARLPAMRTATKQIIDACACGAPTGLAASAITASSATLSWAAVSGAANYTLEYRASNVLTWTTTTVTGTSTTLGPLSANTSYTYRVRANCSGTPGPLSREETFTTLVACPVPTGLAASSITSSSAVISWTAASNAVSYTAEYKTAAASTWTVASGTGTTRTLSGLAASTTYNYRVRNNCSNNTSAYSTIASFTTAAPPCTTPTGLTSSNISTTGATLNWTAVSGASSYNVRYRVNGTSTWTTVTSSTNSRVLTGLTHTTTYEFQIQAVCSGSSSAYSGSATFTTTTPPDILVQIGTGTQAYSGHPYGTGLSDARTQYIITAADLVAGGWSATNPFLTSIAFQVSTAAAQVMNNFTITISHTTTNSYGSAAFLSGTSTTQTYTGNVSAVVGWNTYTFSTPFNYNNTQNLLITLCWDNTTFTSHSIVPTTILPTYQAVFHRDNLASGNLCSNPVCTLSYYRPNMRLNFRAVPQKPTQPGDTELLLVESVELDGQSAEHNLPVVWRTESMPAHEEYVQNVDFQLYPNPFEQTVRLVVDGVAPVDQTVRISTLLGKTILLLRLPEDGSRSLDLDLGELPAGMYFISVGGTTKQLVKQR